MRFEIDGSIYRMTLEDLHSEDFDINYIDLNTAIKDSLELSSAPNKWFDFFFFELFESDGSLERSDPYSWDPYN